MRLQLDHFRRELGVPAVAGGILDASGEAVFDAVGTCRRDAELPVALSHQWHIGSCAKSITALLFARLVELGLVDWSTPVAAVFPDLGSAVHAGWQDRSFEELFYCRAGMRANPSLRLMRRFWPDTRDLTEQRSEVACVAMQKPPHKAGKFVYSNLSYMVIGAAIDRLTGQSFERALDEHVCRPLGITSLGYGPPPEICGHAAAVTLPGVGIFRGKAVAPGAPRSDNPAVFSSAGTLHMTMGDWAKILRLFVTEGGELVQPETLHTLLEGPAEYRIVKGWARADLPGVSFGVQGSNTMWAAAALLSQARDRLSLVVCNDGRTRVVMKSALLAAELLELTRGPTI